MSVSRSEWNELASLPGVASVIDPADSFGLKNQLIDHVHWQSLRKALCGGSKVLDFGCGIGRFAARIQQQGQCYLGIDSAWNMLASARRRNSAATSFVCFDGLRIPLRDGSCELILCCTVLQYIMSSPDRDATLAEFHRVLAPRGRIVMCEHASVAGRTGSDPANCSTIQDYMDSLSAANLKVIATTKIRRYDLSGITRRVLRLGRYARGVAVPLLPLLAKFERRRASSSDEQTLRNIPYFELVIEAEAC